MIVSPSSPSRDEPTSSVVREKTCESCGAPFECRAGACWCDEVRLADEVRAGLRARYLDCLCPACLTSRQKAGA